MDSEHTQIEEVCKRGARAGPRSLARPARAVKAARAAAALIALGASALAAAATIDAFDIKKHKGIYYFENSRRATLAQYAYAQDNPQGWTGYGGNIWGWTASDGPGGRKLVVNGQERQFRGYAARGIGIDRTLDDGTIAPTAAGGSIPFAPEVAIPALMEMKARFGEHIYNRYGFLDAFNMTYTFEDPAPAKGEVIAGFGWVDSDQLVIDQGAILLMVENHRSGLVWETLRKNPHLRRGLERMGFEGGWLEEPAE